MNLCSRHTFCPQKAYDRTLFLFGAIYKSHSHLLHSVTTLILNSKVSRLARLTSHMTLSDATNYYSSRPHRFPRKYKSAETFWRTLVLQAVQLQLEMYTYMSSCYNSSDYINFVKIRNDFKCFIIKSCLLTGQFPDFGTLSLRSSLCVWSNVHWLSKWSMGLSFLLQGHVALSISLNRWR